MPSVQELKHDLKKAVLGSRVLRLGSVRKPTKLAILRYHSVLPNPQQFEHSIGAGIIHSEIDFADQMKLVACKYRVTTVAEACAFARGEIDLPHYSVAITFDDGFADNLEVAVPILERFGCSAAFYLAVDYIENRLAPWYCRLRNAFAETSLSPWIDDYGSTFDLTNHSRRLAAFHSSTRACAQLVRDAQEVFVSRVEASLEVYPFSHPVMLTWAGAKRLAERGHIVGSHTLSHPNVAYIESREAEFELAQSKKLIEEKLDTRIDHFSYPSPILEPHFNANTIRISKSVGYQSAVTCDRGVVERGDDPLCLKRVYVPPTAHELEWVLENTFAGRAQ